MKYLKLVIFVIIVIFITGCNKEYNLYINNNGIVEKFHLELNSDSKYLYILDGDFYPIHNDFEHKFSKSLKEKGNNKILDLEYNYSFEEFLNANSFNQCFDYKNIINDKDYYFIQLSNPNGCMFNEDYTINIITDNKVVLNNADEIKNNKYIWYVNNSDKNSFKLEIKIKKGTAKTNAQKKQFIIYIVLGIFVFLLLSVLYIAVKNRNKNNKV